MRVAIVEVGNLRVLLETKRQSSTSLSTMERVQVCLRHSHDRLREIARDLDFDAVGLLCIYAYDDPILYTGFGRLFQAVSNHLGHV